MATVVTKPLTQTLWVPGPLPGQNEIIAAAKGFGGRGYGYSKLKKQWTGIVQAMALRQKLKPVTSAHINYLWKEPHRRRDPSNIAAGAKFVEDGLVMAGVLSNDGWQDVSGFTHNFTVDADQCGVLVTIEGV